MARRPILAVDTGVVNRLVKDEHSEPYLAAILLGFDVRVPEMTVGEILGTRDSAMRRNLLAMCRRLLGGGEAMLPPHVIIDILVHEHHQNPDTFDWTRTGIRDRPTEDQVHKGSLLDDEELSARQGDHLFKLQRAFKQWFQQPKEMRRANFEAEGKKRPDTFSEWLLHERMDGGHFWLSASSIYRAALRYRAGLRGKSISNTTAVPDTPPSESALKEFTESCPPFRALVTAFELTYYDRCIRPAGSPKMDAGRNDQMMSVYLPYCDHFITAERKRMQEKCLSAIAIDAKIPAQIRSFDDFCNSFSVG